MLVLAVFLLVALRRFFACSVSLRSTLLVLPHASLLFCPFQFIRFFCTLLCYSSCWLSPFLFRVPFCFGRFRFSLLLLAFGCFSLWLVCLRFFSFFVIVLLRLCTPGFFVSFFSFAIVSFAFAFSARFVQSLVVFISGLCYFSWRSV